MAAALKRKTPIVLGLLVGLLTIAVFLSPRGVDAATTSAKKTAWRGGLSNADIRYMDDDALRFLFDGHPDPNWDPDFPGDRWRAYDVGGKHIGPHDEYGIEVGGKYYPPGFDPGYPYDHHVDANPNCGSYWFCNYKAVRSRANELYANKVDWPVDFIFMNNASINKVKDGLKERVKLKETGSAQWLTVADSYKQTDGGWGYCVTVPEDDACRFKGRQLWDQDKGLKEIKCSNQWWPIPVFPDPTDVLGVGKYTHHVRLYADSKGNTENTRDNKMYNPRLGFYVFGTSHFDYHECASAGKWFGWSEIVEWYVAERIGKRHIDDPHDWGWVYSGWQVNNREGSNWYAWQECCSDSARENGAPPEEVTDCECPLHNIRMEGDHLWANDGDMTVIQVDQSIDPRASASDYDDDDPPEPPPPLEPAIDSDINGDDHAEVVALNTSGTAYTYNAFDAAVKTTPFGGGMNSSLFDGIGHHVIDVSDVDADGNADLITLGSNSVVNVYPGQGDRSFGTGVIAHTAFTPGTMGPSGHEPIGVADVNGDKRGDLVTYYAPQKNFYVYPGQADNKFGAGMTLGGGYLDSAAFDRAGSYFVDVADANGDGYADVTATNAYPGHSTAGVEVYRGSPSGIVQQNPEVGPVLDLSLGDGSGHEPLGVADVNGDEKADLVTLNSSGSISVYAGGDTHIEFTGNYQFLSANATTSLSGLNSSLMDGSGDDFVGLIDRTGDGKADLIKVTPEGNVYSASGQSDLKFGSFAYFRNGVNSNRFAVAPGYEMVQEKPFIRRIGCSSNGCLGRPQPTESDVDGDRRSDLVTVDTTGTAHTYRAVGAQTPRAESFAGAMDSALYDGVGHYVIDVADVTGDRRADQVTLANGTINTYLGRADGSFAPTAITSLSGTITPDPFLSAEGYEPIAVADVTGDTKGDLILFKAGQGVKVYPANSGGNGTFGTAKTSLTTLNSALWDNVGTAFFDAADVNGDGRADLVTNTHVYQGQPDGSFAAGTSITVPGNERLGLGDVNGDGRADLVIVNGEAAKICSGTAEGKLTCPFDTTLPGLDSNLVDGEGDEFAGLLDQNGDGKYDLVSVHPNGSAKVYRGREDSTFSAPVTYLLPDFASNRFNHPHGHEVVNEKPLKTRAGGRWPPKTLDSDVQGDGRTDVVTIHSNGAAYVNGHQATPKGTVDPALYFNDGHYLIDAADVTGDGRSDLVTITREGEINVRRGKANGDFESGEDYAGSTLPFSGSLALSNSGGSYEPIAVADVNEDGYADLVGRNSASIVTLLGRADGGFTEEAHSPGISVDGTLFDSTGDYFLDVIDVTGEGRADLVTMKSTGSLVVYKGQPDGGFASVATTAGIDTALDNGTGHEPIGLGDVNADGRADLVTLVGAGEVKLHLANTDGTFTTQAGSAYSGTINSSLMDSSGYMPMGMLDMSDDGRSDIVVTATDNGVNYIYTAQANGTFTGPTNLSMAELLPVARHHIPGHEFAARKPLSTHKGCGSPNGCRWSLISEAVDSDVDGDRRADLTALRASGGIEVHRGDPLEVGAFPTGEPVSSLPGLDSATHDGTGEYAIDTADVTGDKISDLVTIKAAGGVSVYPGSAEATFGTAIASLGTLKPVMVSGGTLEPIAVADVTADGYADLVGYVVAFGTRWLATYKGQASGSFGTMQTSAINVADSALLDGSGDYFIDVADVTGDYNADLVAVSSSGIPRLYRGTGSGQFEAATATTDFTLDPIMGDGEGVEPIGAADVNRDKLADLLFVHEESGSAFVLRGRTDGTFAFPSFWGGLPPDRAGLDSSLTDGFGEDIIGLLDYDRDARADLVTVSTEQEVRTYPALADGGFGDPLLSGPLASSRHNVSAGREFVTEKPAWRRKPSVVPSSAPASWSQEGVSPAGLSPDDVACSSTAHCVAVGRDAETSQAKATLWNGTSWSATSTPSPEGASSSTLAGVSCPTSTNCTAVGSYVEEGTTKKLVLKWDGSTWSILTTPNPSGATSSQLAGVSCPSTTYCAAVGSYVKEGTTRILSVVWSGSSWSTPATPHPTGASSSEFADIHCYANASCLAGGNYVDSGGVRNLLFVNSFFGVWAKTSPAGPSGTTSAEVTDVTCPVSSSCKAVGTYVDSQGARKTLIMEGPVAGASSWSVAASPNPFWSTSSRLSGVSCNSATSCVAVGKATVAGTERPLLAILQGGAWWGQPTPAPASATESRLGAVSCTGASDCRAIGEAKVSGSWGPYAVRR